MDHLPTESALRGLAGFSVVAVAPRAIDLLSIRRCAPVELTLSFESGGGTSATRRPHRFLSLEERYGRRDAWTSFDFDRLLCFEEDIRSLPKYAGAPRAILPYCAMPGWERLARDRSLRARIAAIPADLKRQLDDKGWVRSQLARAGVAVPSTLVFPAAALNYAELIREVGEPLVLQRRFGSSGEGTYLVADERDMARVCSVNSDETTWVVSAHAGDCTVNVHGLVLDDRVEVSVPSLQLTGVSELAPSFGAYCGSDFGAATSLDAPKRTAVATLGRQIGRWLAALGYRGLFGADMAVGSDVSVLEVNPRLQASTWLLGEMELEAGTIPTIVAHFSHLLGVRAYGRREEITADGAAQMILCWQGDHGLRIRPSMGDGVYSLDARDRLRFRRPAEGLLECESADVLVFGLPPPGRTTTVRPGAALARVAMRARLAEGNGRTLTETGTRVATALRAALLT